MVFHHVHEIRGFSSRSRGMDDFQRLLLRIFHILGGDVFVLQHLREHAIARLHTALRMPVRRRIVIGRADDSRQVGAFRKRQLAHVFPEVRHTGFGEAANPEAAAIAQVHFIRVHLKDFLLAEALLQLQRNQGLGQLAPPVAVCGKKEGSRHLHSDGAGALIVLAGMADVRPSRAHDADEIKSAMLEKALVLRRKNGVHQHDREIFVTHRPAFFARAVKKIGN